MRTHEQFADDLPRYALNELTGADQQEFDQHIETCASCRREVQALRSDLGLLALSTAGARPPARSKDRLMRAIAAEPRGVQARAPQAVPRRGLSWALIPAVIALGLLVAVGNLWRQNSALRAAQQELAAAQKLSQWRAPSDTLLTTPGSEMLRSVPRIGQTYLSVPAKSSQED